MQQNTVDVRFMPLTIVFSLIEPKLRMKSSHPTSVGRPKNVRNIAYDQGKSDKRNEKVCTHTQVRMSQNETISLSLSSI